MAKPIYGEPMIISELIKSAAKKLQDVGIDTARLDAMLLLETALGKNRSYLVANSEAAVSENAQKQFAILLKRRINREPISQIIGKKEFYGRQFKVSKDVLTPRPETEFIIEVALKLFNKNSEINILDLGTGSGCIILTLLAEMPNAKGVGVDKSKSALAIAAKNAYDLKIENVEFVHSDWCKNLESQQKFHLIVSNPPYIPKTEQKTLDAELDFEPETALFGGDDGLDCYRLIAKEISGLKFDFAILEIGINQEGEVKKIFEQYQIKHKETLADLAGIPRVIVFNK